MAAGSPVTQLICSYIPPPFSAPSAIPVSEVEDCLIYDRHGACVTLKSLYPNHKAIVIFVRHFLCYTCQEYVEDLSKIPQEMIMDANVRLIVIWLVRLFPYKGKSQDLQASQSLHVKSSMLVGSVKSMWRAMTSPAFDFQGDPLQQGGALIIGPDDKRPSVHIAHFDMNQFNHMPIDRLLQLAGMQVVDFNRRAKIIDV